MGLAVLAGRGSGLEAGIEGSWAAQTGLSTGFHGSDCTIVLKTDTLRLLYGRQDPETFTQSSSLNPYENLTGRCYEHTHFIDENIEAQRS